MSCVLLCSCHKAIAVIARCLVYYIVSGTLIGPLQDLQDHFVPLITFQQPYKKNVEILKCGTIYRNNVPLKLLWGK